MDEVSGTGKQKYLALTFEDASFCGDENSRSSTGITIEVGGFELLRLSQAQPGLPALSSGESDVHSLTRACCCAPYVQKLL